MNFRAIEREWKSGNKEIAIRLLKSMIFEAGLMQKTVMDYCIASASVSQGHRED